jgi:hypothetical protein
VHHRCTVWTAAEQIHPRDPTINDHPAKRDKLVSGAVATAAMLFELTASAELFHTANSAALADLMINGPREPGPFGASGSDRG